MNHQKNVCIDALHTINNNDSSIAVHPKPVSHCESLPTQPYKQVWGAGAQERDGEV